MSNIKLILACIVLAFGLNASANAFTLFDKKFKNYDECVQYVEGATNDMELHTLMQCGTLYDFTRTYKPLIYLPNGATLEYQPVAGVETVKQKIEYLYKNYHKYFFANNSVCKSNCMYLPDGRLITDIPKDETAYAVWIKLSIKLPNNFALLRPWTEVKDLNKEYGQFTQCLINNVEGMITDDAKFKRIISCGDSAKFPRSQTLNMANSFSPEGKRKKEIEAINQRNDQRSAEMNRMNRINTLFLMGTQ